MRDRLLRNPGQIPDMEEVAAEMRMTSRTLRRHLTAEGATFRGLLAPGGWAVEASEGRLTLSRARPGART